MRVLGTGDESSEFRQFPELYWPTIIELSATTTGVPKQNLVKVLAHNPGWTIPQMLEQSAQADDASKIKLMRLMRQTMAEAWKTTRTRDAQTERREAEERMTSYLVQQLDSEVQQVSEAAMENAALYCVNAFNEASKSALRKELLRRGVDIDETWKGKYRELWHIEEEEMR